MHEIDDLLDKLEEARKELQKRVVASGLDLDYNGGRSEWKAIPLKDVEKFKGHLVRPDPDWRECIDFGLLKEYGFGKVPEKDKIQVSGHTGGKRKGTEERPRRAIAWSTVSSSP